MNTRQLAAVVVLLTAAVPAHAHRRTIFIPAGDAAGLVAAVASPANRNARVVLAPGTYALTQHLVLANGVELIGASRYVDDDGDGLWDARDGAERYAEDETVLDASGVPADLVPPLDLCDGLIAAPLQLPFIQATADNAVRNLTIRGAQMPAVSPTIDRSLTRGNGVSYEVTDTIIEDGQIGIGAIHNDCAFRDARSRVTVTGNIVRRMGAAGILFTNTFASGSRWRAEVRRNRAYGNSFGMAINTACNSCDEGALDVESSGNLFEANRFGVHVQGARNFQIPRPANDNRTDWTSRDDRFERNTGAGINVIAVVGTLPSHDNRVRVDVRDGRFSGNLSGTARVDVLVSGGTVGTDNRAVVRLRRALADDAPGAFVTATSVPGNTVLVDVKPTDDDGDED